MSIAAFDRELVGRIAASWPKRATVRGDAYRFQAADGAWDPERPDYPEDILPFHRHPRYQAATASQKQRILTWAWLVYNERVITAEEYVANPAFTMVMHGVFPGADDIELRKAVQQTLIDEHFHTYIHMVAIDSTRRLRGVSGTLGVPHSVTYRRFVEAQAAASEPWEKQLLTLVWTVVSEVSINAYLALMSTNDTIQPAHKVLTALHDRDEFVHGPLMVEVAKSLYVHMSDAQRRSFVQALPKALHAFVAHDFSAWRAILRAEGLEGAEELIADCEHDTRQKTLVRDFSGLRRFCDELGIRGDVDFDFPPPATDGRTAAESA